MKETIRILASLLLFFFFFQTNAQNIFGETVEALEQRLKVDSNLYQRLTARFNAGDTTLTIKELSTLYYGYALNPGFNPAREERVLDAASSLGRRERYEEAQHLLDNFLSKNPACLAALLESGYNAWLMDDSIRTVLGYQKYFSLLEVPLQSGTGESFEKAFVVSSTRDVELVLDKMGFVSTAQSLVVQNGQNYQIVTAVKDENRKEGRTFYFNVELSRRGMEDSILRNKKQ